MAQESDDELDNAVNAIVGRDKGRGKGSASAKCEGSARGSSRTGPGRLSLSERHLSHAASAITFVQDILPTMSAGTAARSDVVSVSHAESRRKGGKIFSSEGMLRSAFGETSGSEVALSDTERAMFSGMSRRSVAAHRTIVTDAMVVARDNH